MPARSSAVGAGSGAAGDAGSLRLDSGDGDAPPACGAGVAPPHAATTTAKTVDTAADRSTCLMAPHPPTVCARCGLVSADGAGERVVDLFEPPGARNLGHVELVHVEDVGDARPLGVDLRQRDRQAELMERVREGVEQARTVLREDLDHRVTGRGAVVDEDLGGDRGARALAPRGRRARSYAHEVLRGNPA